MRRLLQVSMLDPCLLFLTFDMNQIEKGSQHHWKEPLKANKVAEFESDFLKGTMIQFCKITKFYRCEYVTGEIGFQVNNLYMLILDYLCNPALG